MRTLALALALCLPADTERCGGSVRAVGVTGGNRFALVEYPAGPQAHSGLTRDEWDLMRDALRDEGLRVNVTTDATGDVTTVIAHR